MSEPNPYADGEYTWGPPPPAAGYGFAGAGYGQPGAVPGHGHPQQFPVVPAGGPPGVPLLSLGDITVLPDAIVTPAGPMPLKGAVWSATDMSRTEERIPQHAIVLAVVFAVFCLLGLLFLLMKERHTVGFIQVTVTSGGRHHSTLIPATGPESFPVVMGQINYARSLSL